MSVDRMLLARYLRQLSELGGPALYLDTLTAEEFLDAVRRPAAAAASRAAVAANSAGVVAPPGVGARSAAAPMAPRRDDGALTVLAQEAATCTRCRLHQGRRTVVFGEGDPAAGLVVVGEAPGQEEDRTGRPFVGRAGRMLDLLLLTAGFPRETVYICNVLKCRPPNNRDPLPDEVATCTSVFLHPQLDTIAPRVLLAVGKFAAQALLHSDEPIGRLRGRVLAWRGTPLVVTYHPAFLLRSPHMSRTAWEDFQLVRRVFDEQT
jgi:DNA polymerase